MADTLKYDGEREKLHTFKVKLRLKLAEKGSFPDGESRVHYTIGLLEGAAMDHISLHLRFPEERPASPAAASYDKHVKLTVPGHEHPLSPFPWPSYKL